MKMKRQNYEMGVVKMLEIMLLLGILVFIFASVDKKARKMRWEEFLDQTTRYKGLWGKQMEIILLKIFMGLMLALEYGKKNKEKGGGGNGYGASWYGW